MTREGRRRKDLEGRHVLMALIGFFGVMFIANGIFVYFALATFSGGDTSDPYRKGLHYDETLGEAERQMERGWRTEVHYDDKKGRLLLSFLDKSAEPVTGLHVGVTFSRPATDKDDRSVDLAEVSQGVYAADVQLAPGLWVISVDSNGGGEARDSLYRLKQRLFVADRP
jgi:nitrogen fixation protein FixH